MEEPKEPKQIKIKCDTCNHSLLPLDENESLNYVDQSLDEEGDLWIFWKPEDCKNHHFYVCLECKLFKVTDLQNEEYQFIGHMGFHENGSEWSRNSTTRKKQELPPGSKIADLKTPRWDMSDAGKFDFKVDKWLATGPGGYYVFWYDCKTRKNVLFTDQ